MRATFALGVLIGLVVWLNVTALAEDKPDPREELGTAIPEAVRLLENKQYEEFLTLFWAPQFSRDDWKKSIAKRIGEVSDDDLEKIIMQQIAELVPEFGKTKAEKLLQILKAIEGTAPKLDHDGTTATFTHGVKDSPIDIITFVKAGKYWCIKNR